MIYTIGHGNALIEQFVDLIRQQRIQVLVDIRSQPYSRYAPQFKRESLRILLEEAGVQYLYLGDLLGGDRSASNTMTLTAGLIMIGWWQRRSICKAWSS